ncbi:MAG: EVE domain-containing protein [Sphingobacteriaceae bacterium]|nr:MAG: EVE domain-containing protein [Sphingobacteriaceae bacterium]
MEHKTQYWIIAVSKDFLQHGIKGGYMQANDGKDTILGKLEKGDWLIFYSPKEVNGSDKALQAFTGIGQVADDEIYQSEPGDRKPYKRNVTFYKCEDVSAESIINQLNFIENKQGWEKVFRFGFFEIPKADFEIIKNAMLKGKQAEIITL